MNLLRLVILFMLIAGGIYWFAEMIAAPRNYIYYGEPST